MTQYIVYFADIAESVLLNSMEEVVQTLNEGLLLEGDTLYEVSKTSRLVKGEYYKHEPPWMFKETGQDIFTRWVKNE